MENIMGDYFEIEKQDEEKICGQTSTLFPDYVITSEGIVEKNSGKVIDDISISFLDFNTHARKAIHRWAMLHGKMIDNTVMLSVVLMLSESDIMNIPYTGKKTWDEIYTVCSDYLSTGSNPSMLKTVDSVTGEVLSGWTYSNTNLIHIKTGKVVRDVPISALNLNIRAKNGLEKLEIKKISDFIGISYEDLFDIRNLGVGTVSAIGRKLNQYLTNHATDGAMILEEVQQESSSTDETPLSPDIPTPTVLVLAEDYAVVDGEIIRRSDSAQIADAAIETLKLSVRGSNCLRSCDITKVSQLVGMPFSDFRSIRNLGVATANEITEKLELYLESQTVQDDLPAEKLSLGNKILTCFEEDPFGAVTEELLVRLFADEKRADILDAVEKLIGENKLVSENRAYRRVYPSFYTTLEQFTENARESVQRKIDAVRMRSEGKTLEEIGQLWGVTRERVRQAENSILRKIFTAHNGLFREDSFAYLFENYAIEKELLDIVTEHNAKTIYYLEKRYPRGEKSAEEALDDKKLPVSLRREIEDWLNRDYFFVGGERIRINRRAVEDFVVRKYCVDGCSFDTFCEHYNEFLLSSDLSDETIESLLIFDNMKRSQNNRLMDSHTLLWGQNQHLRYYDVDAIDCTELLETLNLGRFQNVEISTKKFMWDYPDLMERYDIRDEYELHNLLKKLDVAKKYPTLHFVKMPTIRFGTIDRERLARDMLFELAPISANGLAEVLSEEYGYPIETIKANWLSGISEYYHQGIFSVDYQAMPDDHMHVLKENLKDDFYYFDDIKKIYRTLIPDADVSLISPYNLKRMGFRVNGIYAFQNFDTAEAYFTHLFTCKEIVDASAFHDRFRNIMMYSQVWKKLREDYTIIEFAPMQYIHISKLQKMGISREDLHDFCDEVYAFVELNSYFTMESLRKHGFEAALDLLGFDTQFYVSILREDRRFANWRLGHNIVFFSGCENPCQIGNRYVSIKAFVANYLQKIGSADVDELVATFESEFNIRLERHKIIEECKDSDLYYDRIMEKLYVNYDAYFEEI